MRNVHLFVTVTLALSLIGAGCKNKRKARRERHLKAMKEVIGQYGKPAEKILTRLGQVAKMIDARPALTPVPKLKPRTPSQVICMLDADLKKLNRKPSKYAAFYPTVCLSAHVHRAAFALANPLEQLYPGALDEEDVAKLKSALVGTAISRYLLVLHPTVAKEPMVAGSKKYIAGRFEGEVRVYDIWLKKPYLGGFKVSAKGGGTAYVTLGKQSGDLSENFKRKAQTQFDAQVKANLGASYYMLQ